ncbi:MAG TPA: MBL fold metallo-hydrolase [Blastocatellia bacterium]|nr:MBL fold metallo-hydrolase [Blastocatellia bacterium]
MIEAKIASFTATCFKLMPDVRSSRVVGRTIRVRSGPAVLVLASFISGAALLSHTYASAPPFREKKHSARQTALSPSAAKGAKQESVSHSSQAESKVKVVMLGTGTPLADPDRWGPSVAIVVNDASYIVDCGPGVVRRAAAAARMGIAALRPANLRKLFITHLHSDHTLGYPDIILSPAVLHRDVPLEVYGPPGVKAMTDHILEAYEEDIRLRIDGLERGNPAGYKVNVHEVGPGSVYKDENVNVSAFPVKHGSWKYALGYKFQTPSRTIVISGDTSPAGSVAQACDGCDILIHEVYCKAGFDKLGGPAKDYHSHFHTSTVELAGIAEEARPGLLVLYHELFFGCSQEDIVKEVSGAYKGKVVSAHDLDVF